MKDKILEIAEIAKACPENLQAICFELLLKDYLGSRAPEHEGKSDSAEPMKKAPEPTTAEGQEPGATEGPGKGQDDLSEVDLHVKARHFLKKYDLKLNQLNNLFYKENGQILLLYDDLKTTRLAESQMRVALLQALRQALDTGDFEFEVQAVRDDCEARKCYDVNNWSNNFKNNATLFDFTTFNKSITRVRLSERGKKELADLVSELQ
jgi:hypothetical protein